MSLERYIPTPYVMDGPFENLGLKVAYMSGDEAICFCPFHDDSRASAEFNTKKLVFHCFGCGTSMGIKELIKEMGVDDDIEFSLDHIETMEGKAIGTIRSQDPDILERYHKAEEFSSYAKTVSTMERFKFHAKYLIDRNAFSTSRELGARFDEHGIIFPIKDYAGVLVGWQLRQLERKPKYLIRGKRTPVWPYWRLREVHKDQPILLTEGVFGAFSGRFHTEANTTFCLMGASHINHAITVLSSRRVLGIFDDDKAGVTAALRLLRAGRGFEVVFPTFEADEAGYDEWEAVYDGEYPTISDPLELYDALDEDMQKDMKRIFTDVDNKSYKRRIPKTWQPIFS